MEKENTGFNHFTNDRDALMFYMINILGNVEEMLENIDALGVSPKMVREVLIYAKKNTQFPAVIEAVMKYYEGACIQLTTPRR